MFCKCVQGNKVWTDTCLQEQREEGQVLGEQSEHNKCLGEQSVEEQGSGGTK